MCQRHIYNFEGNYINSVKLCQHCNFNFSDLSSLWIYMYIIFRISASLLLFLLPLPLLSFYFSLSPSLLLFSPLPHLLEIKPPCVAQVDLKFTIHSPASASTTASVLAFF